MNKSFESPESKFPEITSELAERCRVDQELRHKAMADTTNSEINKKLRQTDIDNTAWLKEIVNKIGWPTVSKVGKQGSSDAWLLAQHADHDIEFQKHCLSLMQEATEGDIDLANQAYLEDRILIKEGKPQIYGTQFHDPDKDGVYEPHPIADAETVEERRAAMGLNTLEENTNVINNPDEEYL